jgi:hypothetical protein
VTALTNNEAADLIAAGGEKIGEAVEIMRPVFDSGISPELVWRIIKRFVLKLDDPAINPMEPWLGDRSDHDT